LGARMDGHGLRLDLRCAAAQRRQARRHVRAAPDLHDRAPRLHRLVARVRPLLVRARADRRPCGSGGRGGADDARHPLDPHLDLPGLVTSGIGLLALVYALIEAHRLGWTSATIIALFAVAAVALTAFVFLELHQRLPMLDLTLFKNGTFTGANLVAILVTLAM